MVIAMKGQPKKFVIAEKSQFIIDSLKLDGQYWKVDEGTDDAAYLANAKRDTDELSAYFKEVRSTYDQEKERIRKEAEATAALMAKGRGKSSAPPVPEPTIPRLKGLAVGIDPTKPPKNFKKQCQGLTQKSGDRHTMRSSRDS